MAYTPYYPNGWQSGSEGNTPITPAALNNMEAGIQLANTLTTNANYGTYASIQSAAADIWDGMTDGTLRVGRFTTSGAWMFLAYRNSAKYAVMLCWSYGTPIRQVNKVNGTVTAWQYSYTTI